MATVVIHGRLSPLDEKDFKAIKKKAGLSLFEYSNDYSWVKLVGSKSQVFAALILLKEKDSFIPDFSNCEIGHYVEGELPIFKSDLRKIMRVQTDKEFRVALREAGLPECMGRQAQRKATPKTTKLQVKASVAEILECGKCLKNNRDIYDLCSNVTANSQREETKWTEER